MSKQRHQSPDHFSSYWALHLDRALQRTEGIVSMNDFARKTRSSAGYSFKSAVSFHPPGVLHARAKGDPS